MMILRTTVTNIASFNNIIAAKISVVMDGQKVPVIAGLVVGIALVLLFVFQFQSSSLDEQAGVDKVTTAELQTKYNYTQIPDLYLITKDDGKRYAGEEGSFCWDRLCADSIEIVPENTIMVTGGSEIEFRIQNYRTPEMFGIYLTLEPKPVPVCREDYDITTDTITQTCDFPDEIPPLTKLSDDFTYRIDLPAGIYRMLAAAYWVTEDGYGESDASYFYLIQVAD